MRRRLILLPAVLVAVCVLASWSGSGRAADPPADRVVAMYFHRTVRCPTCQKMGGYSEEAVKTGYAEQIKQGTVAFHDIDFQDARNAAIVRGYGVTGPTLIVVKVAGNKVASYRNLTDIWSKAGDKAAFFQYVQENVNELLK